MTIAQACRCGQSTRAALGARVEVVFHENGSVRHVFRTVGAVSSFGGNRFAQHIGVASATVVNEVRVRWPARYSIEQVFRHVPIDELYRLREDRSDLQVVKVKSFSLGQSPLHADALHSPVQGMPITTHTEPLHP